MPTVSAQIALALADHVEQVFGVMGNGNAYLLDAFERLPGVTVTTVRHEAGAVVAADAYHRASGGLAVATATYGAGFTNMLTPLAESVMGRVPMVVVVGDQPTSGPRPTLRRMVPATPAAGRLKRTCAPWSGRAWSCSFSNASARNCAASSRRRRGWSGSTACAPASCS